MNEVISVGNKVVLDGPAETARSDIMIENGVHHSLSQKLCFEFTVNEGREFSAYKWLQSVSKCRIVSIE